MLTAAVRDLHRAHPGRFITEVQTRCPELWLNNPYVAAPGPAGGEALRIDCGHPPLLDRSNGRPRHYIEAVHELLSARLDVSVPLTRFAPDLHLSAAEEDRPPHGVEWPYWVMVAGGKNDVTVKWWPARFYQEVVDRFAGRIRFVQAGKADDHHEPLSGVVNLVGRTTLRELVVLVYHADGVICPITCTMHVAAAFDRPCVVVAGGREPPHWEMYPGHQFLHTVGQLPCCARGGCWKARIRRLGDGDQDRDRNLCLMPAEADGEPVAQCMAMIEPEDVCRAVERYLVGARHRRNPSPPTCRDGIPIWGQQALVLDEEIAPAETERTVAAIERFPYPPGRFAGRGVVIGGGGDRYFPGAWVCIKALRARGCTLPIQLWHLGPEEMDEPMRQLLAPLGVETVDARRIQDKHPVRILNGWELKPFSILHCPFEELIFLDADNMPMVDPACLLDTPEYARHGAIFWPDYGHMAPTRSIWRTVGISAVDVREIESGQLVIDKRRCWKALLLTMWLNEHSDFFYRHVYGDKDTYLMAWRKVGQEFAMPAAPIRTIGCCTMCQHDFAGRRILQHRNGAKWNLRHNRRVAGFQNEQECFGFLAELRRQWSGHVGLALPATPQEQAAARAVVKTRAYDYIRVGHDRRPMELLPPHRIGKGAARCEREWWVTTAAGRLSLAIYGEEGLTCRLYGDGEGIWRGQWERHEKMPVELLPRG